MSGESQERGWLAIAEGGQSSLWGSLLKEFWNRGDGNRILRKRPDGESLLG
jgi:hypothetical protein